MLYADDILLISSSVSHSELLLHACERELEWIDMAINFNTSCFLCIGPRHSATCAAITSITGCKSLSWVTSNDHAISRGYILLITEFLDAL